MTLTQAQLARLNDHRITHTGLSELRWDKEARVYRADDDSEYWFTNDDILSDEWSVA